MTPVIAAGASKAPDIDWAGLSPLVALLGAAIVVLLAGLLRSRFARAQVVPALSVAGFGAALGCALCQRYPARLPTMTKASIASETDSA